MDLMVGLLQRSSAKLPNHQKIVSQQDNQECNEKNDCWEVVKLAISGIGVGMLEGVVMMMVPTEGIKGTEKGVVHLRLQKTLTFLQLYIKSLTLFMLMIQTQEI